MSTESSSDGWTVGAQSHACSRRSPFLTLALSLLVIAICVGCVAREQTISYFYLMACVTCEESQRMEQIAGRVVGLSKRVSSGGVKVYDITYSDGMQALRHTATNLGVDVRDLSLPVLIVNETLYSGEEAVTSALVKLEARAGR